MCLITVQMQNSAPVSKLDLRNGWNNNPHGAGLMYCHEDKLMIEKPFFKFKDFYKRYMEVHEAVGRTSPIVTHLRFATHGLKNETNTHPHRLHEDVGLVHNGVLYDFYPPDKCDLSDTAWFAQTVLGGRSAEQLMSVPFCEWLEKVITSWNKFVLLDNFGTVRILHENQGHWSDDIWYSNHSYWPRMASSKAGCSPEGCSTVTTSRKITDFQIDPDRQCLVDPWTGEELDYDEVTQEQWDELASHLGVASELEQMDLDFERRVG